MAARLIAALLGALLALPAGAQDLVSPAARELIIRWEVTSQARYERLYRRPIWPGGASGVTIGIGYDLGHQPAVVIRQDWVDHPQVAWLPQAAGVRGAGAQGLARAMAPVETPWALAERVFSEATIVTYYRRARRAFPGFERLHPDVQGALVSLVYNRGTAMNGDSRREMAVIRDRCVPAADGACIAAQLRAMCRIWRGTPNERGLCARREDEARLVERAGRG